MKFTKETLKRMLSIVLTAAMVITSVSLPQVSPKVYAESSISAPSSSTFLTNEQLMALTGSSGNEPYYADADKGIFQKANYGGKTWYVIGNEKVDGVDTLIMLSDSSITKSIFDSSSNLYIRSYIYKGLNSDETSYMELAYNVNTLFGETAKAYVKPVRKFEDINSYLYLPDGNPYEDKYNFKVGSDNQYRIPISTWKSNNTNHKVDTFFWLRSAYPDNDVFSVCPGSGDVSNSNVGSGDGSVVPAFNLNLSSVIFASAASAATGGAGIDSENVMTFRFDSAENADGENASSDRISATAKVNKSEVTISNAGENEYLYVQWNDNGTDKVYSCEATNETVSASTIGGDGFEITPECKIWIEKKIDNIVYAKNAEFVRTYWTKDELKSLGNGYVYYKDSNKKFQKANFVGKTWYVIGSEKVGDDDTLVMLSDSQIATSKFDNNGSMEYSTSYIYNGLNSTDNEYTNLEYNVNKLFGKNAKEYVKLVTVDYVNGNKETKSVDSYLYLPDENVTFSRNFKVGSNNQYTIPINKWKSNNSNHGVSGFFWLRAAEYDYAAYDTYVFGV